MFKRHPVLTTALVAAFAALSSTAVFAESPTPEPTGPGAVPRPRTLSGPRARRSTL